jgi:hypothetical protein
VAQVQPLVPELQGEANTASIRQGGQLSQGAVVIQVLRNQSQPASLRQAGIGVWMHGV